MMRFLRQRDADLAELMDAPSADPERLFLTYSHFSKINPIFSRRGAIYRRFLRPRMRRDRALRVLDIGFGGGDVLRAFAKWARQDGCPLEITAIDNNPRALEFVRRFSWPESIRFRACDTATLIAEGARFDAVITNAVLHHLQPPAARQLLADSQALAGQIAVHNDTTRSLLAYLLFLLVVAPWFLRSFAASDGLRTLRRSYRISEWRACLPPGWRAEPLFPFRYLLVWDNPKSTPRP